MVVETGRATYLKTIGLKSNQPVGRGFVFPYDVAFSGDGRLFVLNRGRASGVQRTRVQICTLDEDYLGEFGNGVGQDDDQFRSPVSMCFSSDDLLYITDEVANEIKVFDSSGRFVRRWGPDVGGGPTLGGPAGLAIDADGNLYISEQRSHRVHKLSPDGESILTWGEPGNGPGQLNRPWGVALDSDDNVYVADWKNDRIQKFTPDGDFLDSFGEPGYAEGQLNRPSSVVVDGDGFIYVADWGNERVQVFNPDGGFRQMLRGEATLSKWAVEWLESNLDQSRARDRSTLVIEDLPSRLRTPYHVSSQNEALFWGPVSVKLDDEERLYVTEHSRSRIQIYETN